METTRHFTATTIIVFDQKVLLRFHKKLGLWLPVGGHIERDELPHTAAIREAKEESGLEIELYNPDLNMDISDAEQLIRPMHILLEEIQPGHEHIDFIYYARTYSDQLNIPEEQRENYRWISMNNLDSIPGLLDNVKVCCLDALNCIYN